MLKDDFSVAHGIRQEKFERNVRKKGIQLQRLLLASKFTFAYINFTLHIFTDVNLLYIY